MATTGTVRPATANSTWRDRIGMNTNPIHIPTNLAYESHEMNTSQTCPSSKGALNVLLQLTAEFTTGVNATSTSPTSSGEPSISKSNTDSTEIEIIVGLRISRIEIETHATKRAVAFLQSLTQEKNVAWAARGKLALTVDGYNDDPREIYEIPEVRRFLKTLHSHWKYWFFFANEICSTLSVVLNSVVAAKKLSQNTSQVEADSFNQFYSECASACNELFDKFGFPEEENQKQLLSAYKQLIFRA